MEENKPDELVRISIIRARFLELVGIELKLDSGELFMLGLFSLIDAMLDNAMDYLVAQLPLNDAVCLALVHRRGPLADFLVFIESYEIGNWARCQELGRTYGLPEEKVVRFYVEACGWAGSY